MKWKLAAVSIGLFVVLATVSGCQQTEEKSYESAEEIKRLANEFNSLIEEMEVPEKITEIESKVSEGLITAKDFTVNAIKNNQDKKPQSESGAGLIEATVTNWVDGDTFDVALNSGHGMDDKTERIRLILVDTPESQGKYKNNPQPYALAASDFTRSILSSTSTVWLEIGVQERDPYGRLLAYVWLDGVSYKLNGQSHEYDQITLNELLLREGLARVAIFPPNTQYLDEFTAAEKEAKKNKLGMWGDG